MVDLDPVLALISVDVVICISIDRFPLQDMDSICCLSPGGNAAQHLQAHALTLNRLVTQLFHPFFSLLHCHRFLIHHCFISSEKSTACAPKIAKLWDYIVQRQAVNKIKGPGKV